MQVINQQDLFIRYGSSASEVMFDYPRNCFQIPGCEGIIVFRLVSNCAMIFGEPLCPPEETSKLLDAFHAYCKNQSWNIFYIIVSESFARTMYPDRCKILIEVCEENILDPFTDPCIQSKRLHHRVDEAIKHGLTFHEFFPPDPEIESSLKEMGIKWQQAIRGPNVFLGHLDFFDVYEGKRWFYVKDGEQITGMIMLSRLDALQGWFLKFLITLPGAFHYTSEFLMISVLELLKKENCHYLSKGMLPLESLKEIHGVGKGSTMVLRSFYKIINWIFKFKTRKEYWRRYNPKIVPTYLLMASPKIGLNEIRALATVFRKNY